MTLFMHFPDAPKNSSRFLAILDPIRAPQNDQKSILGQKKAPGCVFLAFFGAHIVFLVFGLDFSSICDEKVMKKQRKYEHFFKSCAGFFQPGEPLKPCTGAVFRALLTFFVFPNFVEEVSKKHRKTGIPKNIGR